MPWGGAGGQTIEHPHSLAILSSISFCFKYILVLLARRNTGKLCCYATALIHACGLAAVVFENFSFGFKCIKTLLNDANYLFCL